MQGELIVIDVETLSSGIPSNNLSISASDETDTPQIPTSPSASGASASQPISVGISNAVDKPVCPCSSRYLKRWFVSSGVPNPANCLIVQSFPLYILW